MQALKAAIDTLDPALVKSYNDAAALKARPPKRSYLDVATPPKLNPGADDSDPGLGPLANAAFTSWGKITDTISDLKTHPEAEGYPTLIKCFEKIFDSLANDNFNLAHTVDSLLGSVNETSSVIKANTASGNIANSIESSAEYKDLVNDTKNSLNEFKLLDLNMGEKIDDHSKLKSKAYEVLNAIPDVKDLLSHASVIPLGKSTTVRNGLNTVAILIKTKSKPIKEKLEKATKAANLKPAFHWPKRIFDNVTKIRAQVLKFKDDKIDMSQHQVMIRPNESGKSLSIYYRSNIQKGKWSILEVVKTPADDSLLKTFKTTQICTSEKKYFSL
jgi:hypothetical protein